MRTIIRGWMVVLAGALGASGAAAKDMSSLAPLASMDMPNAQPSTPPAVMVAQAIQPQQDSVQQKHVLGVCEVANPSYGGKVSISPMTFAESYVAEAGIAKIDFATAKITIVQQPKHGHLEPDSDGDWRFAYYLADENFLGNDSFAVKVEASGYAVTIRYFMAVNIDIPPTYSPECKSLVWKISSNADATNQRQPIKGARLS